MLLFFFSSRRRHTRSTRDWSSDVCSSDLGRWARDGAHPLLDVEQLLAVDIVPWGRALSLREGVEQALRRRDAQRRRKGAARGAERAVGVHDDVVDRFRLTRQRVLPDEE